MAMKHIKTYEGLFRKKELISFDKNILDKLYELGFKEVETGIYEYKSGSSDLFINIKNYLATSRGDGAFLNNISYSILTIKKNGEKNKYRFDYEYDMIRLIKAYIPKVDLETKKYNL
jgi:hypothetical protein